MPAVESTFTADDRDDFVLSARYGELEDLKAYLDKGMNVSAKDENGNTALHMAAANGHTGLATVIADYSRTSDIWRREEAVYCAPVE